MPDCRTEEVKVPLREKNSTHINVRQKIINIKLNYNPHFLFYGVNVHD